MMVVVPAALLLPKTTSHADDRVTLQTDSGFTLAQAVRTGMFWVISAAVATTSMLGTALGFHQIALLGERGLSPFEAASNFLPQTVTALLATPAVGALIDRADPRIFMVLAMVAMAGSLALVGVVETGWLAILYGLAASALGPFALAVGADMAGNFALPALLLATIPAAVLVAAIVVKPPKIPASESSVAR